MLPQQACLAWLGHDVQLPQHIFRVLKVTNSRAHFSVLEVIFSAWSNKLCHALWFPYLLRIYAWYPKNTMVPSFTHDLCSITQDIRILLNNLLRKKWRVALYWSTRLIRTERHRGPLPHLKVAASRDRIHDTTRCWLLLYQLDKQRVYRGFTQGLHRITHATQVQISRVNNLLGNNA